MADDPDPLEVVEQLLERLGRLEAIAARLAAASVDPVAVADYWAWVAGEG